MNIEYNAALKTSGECAVCLDAKATTCLSCNHQCFCATCIERWEAQTCPLCRAPITWASTNDPAYYEPGDEELLVRTIHHLAKKHFTSQVLRNMFLHMVIKAISNYDATKVLKLYDMHQGFVELLLSTHTLKEIGRLYYQHRHRFKDLTRRDWS